MSTRIVSKKHIDIVVTAYSLWKPDLDLILKSKDKTLDKVGQILWKENYKSSTSRDQQIYQIPKYSFTRCPANLWQVFRAIEALDSNSAGSLSYLKKSEAWKILDRLKGLIMYTITTSSQKYRKAEWLIEDYDVF